MIADEAHATLMAMVIVLASAGLIATLAQRFRVAVVPAFLVTGVILGPNATGVVAEDALELITDFAIILLLFGIGLQIHLDAIRRGAAVLLGAGLGSVLLCAAIGWGIGLAFGLPTPVAIIVSLALTMSSTAVVLRTLTERKELHQSPGRLSFAILIVQDLAVPLVLVLIPVLASAAGGAGESSITFHDGLWDELWQAFRSLAGVLMIVVVGRFALPYLLREAARSRSPEVTLSLSVAAAIGAAAGTHALGFSHELGAFLAGVVLADTPFRHQLSGQIGPARDLFMAAFFTAVGMVVDPRTLVDSWWIVILGAGLLVVLKGGAISLASWAAGAPAATAVLAGCTLAQGGEFSLVILKAGLGQGLIDRDLGSRLVSIIVLSLIVTPLLMAAGRSLSGRFTQVSVAPWVRKNVFSEELTEDDDRQRVIVAGFGPVGRAVVDRLTAAGVACTIIELNPATVDAQTKLGRRIIFGDASNEAVLESAGVERAEAVILTIPDDEATLRACEMIRRLAPTTFIAARANFVSRGMLASGLGADLVTVDELAAAEIMQREVIDRLREKPAEASSAD